MPTVAQISDLHLSPRVPARQAQVEPILQAINVVKPDLVVISGDLTDDGWERPEDLVWAKGWIGERLDGVFFAVPGNHDVGNFASLSKGKISDAQIQNWCHVFDPMTLPINFCVMQPWSIIGINSMVFGSGLDSEKAYIDRLERELRLIDKGSLHLAAVIHSPLFVERPEDTGTPATDYWLGSGEARFKLWDRLRNAGIKLIASGHVHQTKIDTIDGTNIVWAPPASGTWVHAPGLPNPPAPKKTGIVLHHLGDDGSVRSEIIECAPMLKTVEFDPLAE